MSHILNLKIREFCEYLNEKYNSDVRLYVTGNGDLKLDNIRVPKKQRKQGIGTSIMNEIIDFADNNQLRLILTTAVKDPHVGTTSSDRLKKFYKRFDFVENKGKDFSISENMFRMPKNNMHNFLDKANKLDDLGYHKEADAIVRIILAQQATTSISSGLILSPKAANVMKFLAQSAGGLNNFLVKFTSLIKAIKTGQVIPGMLEDVGALNALKQIFSSSENTAGLVEFLQRYPQLTQDLKIIKADQMLKIIDAARTQNPSAFISELKNINQAYNEAKTIIQNTEMGIQGVKGVQQTLQLGSEATAAKNTTQTIFKAIEDIQELNLEKQGIEYLRQIDSMGDLRSVLTQMAEQFPDKAAKFKQILEATKHIPNNAEITNGIIKPFEALKVGDQAAEVAEGMKSGFQLTEKAAETGTELAAKALPAVADAAAAEAAVQVAAKVPGINYLLGPLSIILSLPTLKNDVDKIISGELDDRVWVDIIANISNVVAGVSMMIPGGQPLALALGAFSLTLQGASWLGHTIADKMDQPNPEDLKITGDIDKLSPEQKEQMQSENKKIDDLINDVAPKSVYSPFYAFAKDKNKLFPNIKFSEYLSLIQEWVKSSPSFRTHNWILKPSGYMYNQFAQKLSQEMQIQKATGGDVNISMTYKSLEDVKKTIDANYSQNPYVGNTFKENKPLKTIIQEFQKMMKPTMPAGTKNWFANVPLSLDDKNLLIWFNQHPNPSDW